MGMIRLLLALSVALSHHFQRTVLLDGEVAVEGFYVISGFYMTMVLREKYPAEQGPWTFWKSRYLRLAPAWVILLVLNISVLSIGISNRFSFRYGSLFLELPLAHQAFVIFANLTMFFQDTLSLLIVDPQTGALAFSQDPLRAEFPATGFLLNPPGWTLGLELGFYVLAPFLLRRNMWVVFTVFAASILFRMFLSSIGLYRDPFYYRFLPSELATFLLGYFAYLAYVRVRKSEWARPLGRVVLLIMLVLAACIYPTLDGDSHSKMIAVALSLAFSLPFIFAASRHWKADDLLGSLSYPLYVSHWFPGLLGLGPVSAIALTVSLSIILVAFVERPMDRMRRAAISRKASNKMTLPDVPRQ